MRQIQGSPDTRTRMVRHFVFGIEAQMGCAGNGSGLARYRHHEIHVDAVYLSFSTAYSPALAAQGLRNLRQTLPEEIALWAGGYGVKPIRKPIDDVCLAPEFLDLFNCLTKWRINKRVKNG